MPGEHPDFTDVAEQAEAPVATMEIDDAGIEAAIAEIVNQASEASDIVE